MTNIQNTEKDHLQDPRTKKKIKKIKSIKKIKVANRKDREAEKEVQVQKKIRKKM